MIRDKLKIYAEPNNPNSVRTTEILTANKLLKASNTREIVKLNTTKQGIFYTDASGNAQFLEAEPNKILVTDSEGNLKWRDR